MITTVLKQIGTDMEREALSSKQLQGDTSMYTEIYHSQGMYL